MISANDIVLVQLEPVELNGCIQTAMHLAQHMIDRSDLHQRDCLERFINTLMGEIAEQMVIKWLRQNNKDAKSASNKEGQKPDPGHGIEVRKKTTHEALLCSVKSSLAYQLEPASILDKCRLATKQSELRDINIQVYFWLTLNPQSKQNRVTVPAIRQSAIIGWFGRNDLKAFCTYKHEQRQTPLATLNTGRSMASLLDFLA